MDEADILWELSQHEEQMESWYMEANARLNFFIRNTELKEHLLKKADSAQKDHEWHLKRATAIKVEIAAFEKEHGTAPSRIELQQDYTTSNSKYQSSVNTAEALKRRADTFRFYANHLGTKEILEISYLDLSTFELA